jgi:hypothetical protein
VDQRSVHRLVAIHFHRNFSHLRVVDHIDGDRQNNHVSNLRWCTQGQNQANRKKTSFVTSSRFKGVYLQRSSGKWIAAIGRERRRFHIGVFSTEQEAADAYDSAAREQWGEFARTNAAASGVERPAVHV